MLQSGFPSLLELGLSLLEFVGKKTEKLPELAVFPSILADIEAELAKMTRGIRIRGRIGLNPAKRGLIEVPWPPSPGPLDLGTPQYPRPGGPGPGARDPGSGRGGSKHP